MSQENVEIVRQFVERWQRLDWDGLTDLVDPDVEQVATVGGVEEGAVMRGLDAIRRDYEQAEETWEEHRIEPERTIANTSAVGAAVWNSISTLRSSSISMTGASFACRGTWTVTRR